MKFKKFLKIKNNNDESIDPPENSKKPHHPEYENIPESTDTASLPGSVTDPCQGFTNLENPSAHK